MSFFHEPHYRPLPAGLKIDKVSIANISTNNPLKLLNTFEYLRIIISLEVKRVCPVNFYEIIEQYDMTSLYSDIVVYILPIYTVIL